MGGKVTVPFCPLQGRLAIGLAVGTRFEGHYPVATFAGFNDGITSPAVVGTAVLLHKNAFRSGFVGLALHGFFYPLSLGFIF